MKIVAVNGGPRKGKNTDQMLDAFIEGVKSAAPDAEVEVIRLYDYAFKGCMSCFACQLEKNRDDLGCRIKDDVTELLRDTFHADGIVFASPIYYCNVSAQLRLFWERLQYPGHSPKAIPTALIYTMNANEEQTEQFMGKLLELNSWYLEGCFGVKPEVVCSYDTFQYNDSERFNAAFREPAARKKALHDQKFTSDLRNARDAGTRLVHKIKEVQK